MSEANTPPIDWDEHAANWDEQAETHVYAEKVFGLLEPVVHQHLMGRGDLRILDFGAGTGLLTVQLAPLAAEVVAVDPSTAMIDQLKSKLAPKALTNVVPVAELLDEALCKSHDALQRPFDLIVASSVCTFLPDFGAQLTLLAGLLNPGGLFVHWDWHAGADDWVSGFTVDDASRAHSTAGLKTLSCEVAFDFSFGDKTYEVLMGVAQKGPAENVAPE